MGLFDIFKKKLDVSISINSKTNGEFKKEYESSFHTPSSAPLNREPYGISLEEISFLEYADGHDSNLETFSKKFLYEYGLDYKRTVDCLLQNQYLRYGTGEESLSLYSVQDLKDFLKCNSLPVSGNKETLIKRIIENCKDFGTKFNRKNFMVTDKGHKVIHQYKVDYGVPLSDQEERDLQYREYSHQIQEHLTHGKWGLYAMDIYNSSEILRKEKRYKGQLQELIISTYFDLSGFDDDEYYFSGKKYGFKQFKPNPFVPPAIVKNTSAALSKLNMSLEDYSNFFKEVVDTTMFREHVFSIEECIEIMLLYLKGESKKAEGLIKKGIDNFVKTH